jgi:topoisomerase-4 subunit B
VTRFKGLGEMNPEQLRETVFDPVTRRIVQVTLDDSAHVAETVKLLMGGDAAPRRSWLEEAAADVEVEV